jgi:rhodanese-related sulfurtransferase
MVKKVIFIFLISILFFGCYEGYTGPDGEMLAQYLDEDAFKALTENPVDDIWIIDVRPASAYESGHVPTAKSFPSSEIEDRLNELPKDKYLIFYCETGGRAQKVITSVMEPAGYTKFMNWGGYTRWSKAFN